MLRRLRGINFIHVGIVIVLLSVVGGYGGLFSAWQNSNVAKEWAKYAHELETRVATTPEVPTAAQAVAEADTSVPAEPSSTPIVASLTPVPATLTPTSAATQPPTPTSGPQMGFVTHDVIRTNTPEYIEHFYESQDENWIRSTCYSSEISATVPLTDVLDYGGTALIKIVSPELWVYHEDMEEWEYLGKDGYTQGHVKLTHDGNVFEADFVDEVAIPCLANRTYDIEIVGDYHSASGAVIHFDNKGKETNYHGEGENPWRRFHVERGMRSIFLWTFEWSTEQRWEELPN